MKAFLTWLTNSFAQFLDGLQATGATSPSPSCENCLSANLPKSSPPPINASIKKPKKENPPMTKAEADFQKLLDQQGIRYFTAKEVFFRGARDAKLKLNTEPPRGLWPSLLAVVKVADEARHRLGKPLRINSAYRSPKYNRAINGSVASQHLKAAALDLSGSPATLHGILKKMRSEGFFKGGIGKYRTFNHVDVRGRNADWNG
jgi:uncharacterized protein YcbK (DUF882 family)